MNITKSAPLPERPCEQLTCCEKNGSVQGNYINRVAKRHNCRITGKTKATRYGGPSTQATRYPQRKRADYYAVITSGWQCDQCAGLLVGYSCSLALRRWRYSTSRFNAAVTNCPVLSPGIFTASTLFITSCGTLAATVCDFAFTAFVAMLCTPHKKPMQYAGKKISVQHLTCLTPRFKLVFNTLLMQGAETTKPRTVGAVTGLLTKPLTGVTIMAGTQHTQTHPDYSSISTLEACHG